MRAMDVAILILASASVMFAQNPVANNGSAGGRGGPGAAPPAGPAIVGPMSTKDVPPWGAIRTGAQGILGWRIGIALNSFPNMTFAEAAVKADALG
jgi:hypothetical protein